MAERARPLITLLASPETSPSVLYGLYDVLYSAGAIFPDMTVGEPGAEMLDVRIVADEDAPFRIMGNVLVEPHAAIHAIPDADVVVVCDMYMPICEPPRQKYPREFEWLRRMHGGGALITSVCSGSVVLAEAGLLDGHEAACHWAYRDLFRRCYPAVRLIEDSVLCLSSESDRIVTAGGVTAWQDLAIHLIARLCGHRLAVETAKVFLLPGHEDGQLPYAAMLRRIDGADAVIADSQSWIAQNYGEPNPVRRMVERSKLNARTFSRRFRAATGYHPIDYVQTLRVEEAKQMLETEALAIDEIAAEVGYEDPASFRRVFKRRAGLTPTAYRRKFRALTVISPKVEQMRLGR
jgi:transcriptional regulator GlxA family with amidase domain